MTGLTRRERAALRVLSGALTVPEVPRSFAAHPGGRIDVLSPEEAVRLAGVSAAAPAAYDVMSDDGVPPETAWEMALAAERQGRDPEAFARHFVKLRKAIRR